ncbi:hypothetical protein J503_2150 [Acinetobacter baumannii 984213]|uniref:virulence factor TspB C-terminal domain-related protein n=1 Tax=Acinetobacter baumannii TaxID=470 RepID=UPI0002B93FAF|nr:virulence factor TspB C-terminal domain-related protein [Acinetobacter baumannii]EKU4533788.1 hypothetical protein [Acinetobacter baumannii]EKU4537655.1 hypothetical protein [Acinetobacter baumannii]EKV4019145.1 hypothetical protein [Acinetobacter baumannii]EKW0219243.1 hypothetical protein [Acinetobacter baumannii]EKX4017125.1 hypothetical protein [Acinetobacter baumannii]
MGSITSYCVKVIKDNFKLLTWLQIFIIAITPNFIFFQSANATTVSGDGWSVSKALVQGATTTYNGAKTVVLNGISYTANGVAKVTPTAGQVSKMIVRTGAVAAVTVAIQELIGAVDYVMDPANNRVIYHGYGYAIPNVDNLCDYIISGAGYPSNPKRTCLSIVSDGTNSSGAPCLKAYADISPWGQVSAKVCTPAIVIEEDKYLAYDTVAAKVISNAEAENADAKSYVSSVADTALDNDEQRQIVPASDVTQQLNNSQAIPTNGTGTGTATPTTGTGTGTGTGDPTAQPQPYDITINFPIFCNWAPTICQAAQAGINYVASYTKDVDALKKEYGDNPKFDDKPLEFDKDPATPDTTISFGGGCPAPLNAPYSFMGISGSIEIPFTPFCKIAEVSKPVIIAVSAYFAALIIGGIRSGDA